MSDAEAAAFIAGQKSLQVGTIDRDGGVHLSTLWFAVVDDRIVFETYTKSQKIKNLERDDRITVLLEDGDAYENLRGVDDQGPGPAGPRPGRGDGPGPGGHGPQPPRRSGEALQAAADQMSAKRTAVIVEPARVASWTTPSWDEAMTGAHPLLDIQRLDTEADQHRYRRDNLAERPELDQARAELSRQQQRIDATALERVETVNPPQAARGRGRHRRGQGRPRRQPPYSGEIQSLRDLRALQDEIAGLRSSPERLGGTGPSRPLKRPRSWTSRCRTLEEARAAADREAGELRPGSRRPRPGSTISSKPWPRPGPEPRPTPTLICWPATSGCGRCSAPARPSPSTRPGVCGCPSAMPAVEFDRVKRCPPGSVLDCEECGRIVLR